MAVKLVILDLAATRLALSLTLTLAGLALTLTGLPFALSFLTLAFLLLRRAVLLQLVEVPLSRLVERILLEGTDTRHTAPFW